MVRRALSLSFAAGIFISIGGAVFLSCENSVIGAVLFSAEVFLFLAIVVVGNSVGGMFIPALRKLAEEKKV